MTGALAYQQLIVIEDQCGHDPFHDWTTLALNALRMLVATSPDYLTS